MTNDKPGHETNRERDMRVLFRTAGGFGLLACVAWVLCNTVTDREFSRAMGAMGVVCSIAGAVLFVWAISAPAAVGTVEVLYGLFDYLRLWICFVITLQPASSRKRIALWLALTAALTFATHQFFSWRSGIESGVALRQHIARGSYIYTVPNDGPNERYNYATIKYYKQNFNINLMPETPRDGAWMNWYRRESYRGLQQALNHHVENTGWTAEKMRREIDQCRAEYKEFEKRTPETLESLKETIQAFPEIGVLQTNVFPEVITLTLNNRQYLAHSFAPQTKIWTRTNGEHIWIRQDCGSKHATLIDTERKMIITAYEEVKGCGTHSAPSLFGSLGACLTAITGAWLLLLAPFFLLRPAALIARRPAVRPRMSV